MTEVKWGGVGTRLYEAGVSRGVLYPKTGPGVPWNGLISVSSKHEGGDAKAFNMDGIRLKNIIGVENFAATIKAYTYPNEFYPAQGIVDVIDTSDLITQKGMQIDGQYREPFGMSYVTDLADDISGTDRGYKIHLIYNAMALPDTQDFQTNTANPDMNEFSWDIVTTPVNILGRRPTAHFVIDTTKADEYLIDAIEDILYGRAGAAPRLPSPASLISLSAGWLTFKVVDNKDGTWTASGPSQVIHMVNQTTFEINWYSVTLTGPDSYTLSSK